MGLLKWAKDNMPTLLRPAVLLTMAAYHFIMTILEIVVVERQPFQLRNLQEVRYRSFARLWIRNGADMSAEMPEGLDELLQQCRGIILDVGPGSGELLSRFNPNQINAMYGAEPAAALHPGLIANAKKQGFGDKYRALLCGGEPTSLIPALSKSNILAKSGTGGTAENGVFDEILCLRVLCGVPQPRETLQNLYSLLKPGGRMVVCEHVANPWRSEGKFYSRIAQVVYTVLGWPFFMGGCEMQRHTREYLLDAGRWKTINLRFVDAKAAIPFVVGELVKVDN
ncbi:hypothetical protein K491DRAFT_636488 [Lophiostoma macrostomum CBS 122681]|uniref:S-adenosyl-L-methionine-dependent methyltransferase n=1 Tax=Lophiostoma macrostomum CBS 122681 TaxID=1314788 RepID=A0A6A6SWF0_9PLEO|nr:hypothetical protein K491DRAFT_636488 [Lophiostoma macrostomum CBS 122681]